MTDTITLTIPAEPRYRSVATLVLGGVGTRLDLPYERMDELQLAVLSVLEAGTGRNVSVRVEAGDDVLTVSVGPLVAGSSADDGLGRVLARLVDEVVTERRDGEEWLTLRLAGRG
jgi:anti-sigma regulatory factor (Ser/Thr protein kinase)